MSAFFFTDSGGRTVPVSSQEAVSLHTHTQSCSDCSPGLGRWCNTGEELRRALRAKNEQLFGLQERPRSSEEGQS